MSDKPKPINISDESLEDLRKKAAENPGTLAFPTNTGSAVIRPEDMGKTKSRALRAMREQTGSSMDRIKAQMERLVKEAHEINNRVIISEKIYMAKMSFEPLMGHQYYLYEDKEQNNILSMIAPDEWGVDGMPYEKYYATVRLLHDHTWDIIEENMESEL